MSRLDEIKKKLKNSNTGEEQSTTSRLDRIKQQVNGNKTSTASMPTDLSDLYNEYSSYLKDAETSYGSMNYGNAGSTWKTINERKESIRKLIEDTRIKYNLNRSDLTDEERELNIYLNKMDWSLDDVEQGFLNAFKGYSQYKTEDDYNKAVENAKTYEEQKTVDLDAYLKETEEMKAELERRNKKGTPSVSSYKYANVENLEDVVAERVSYYNQAKKIQNEEKLSGASDPNSEIYDKEFEIYVGKGKEEGIKIAEENWFSADEYANPIILWREDPSKAASMGNPVAGYTYEPDAYWAAELMTDDEYKNYVYYWNKFGDEKAQEYLDSIRWKLDARKGNELYEGVKDNAFAESIFTLAASANGALENVGNLFSNKDYYDPSATQIALSMLKEDAEGDFWGELRYDALSAIGNMLPSVLVSFIPGVGQVAGSALLGASAAGGAKADMINRGYSKAQANAYGVMVGISEVVLEKFLGGIVGVSDGGIFSKLGTKALTKVDNAFARVAITLGGRMADEALEEMIQSVLEPWLESVVTGADFEAPNIDEVLYSGLLGAITAGAFDIGGTAIGTGTIAENVRTYSQGKTLINQGIDVNKLASYGSDTKFFSADSVAYRLAGKVNEKTGAYTIGRLFNELDAQLTTQNQADIIRSLERKGIASKDAKTIATALAQVVAGEQITEKQAKALEGNPLIAQTIQDVIINQNSTVNQRLKGFAEATQTKASTIAQETTGQAEVTAQTENTPVEQSVENEPVNVSDSGKTVNTTTGEEVNIQKVTETKGGLKVELDNGMVVSASDLSYSTKEEALMYEMAARMEASPTSTNTMLNAFKPSSYNEASMYYVGVPLAYQYGKIGYEAGLKSIKLSQKAKQLAYKLGREDAQANATSKDNARATEPQKAKSATAETKAESKSIIYENGFTYDESKASDIQKVSMAYIDVQDDQC